MFSRARITNPSIACAAGTDSIAGFAPGLCRFEAQNGEVIRWYGTCSDIHDSKLLEQSMRESAIELEKMVDERTARCGAFPGA